MNTIVALHRRQMDPTWISWSLPHIDVGVGAEHCWGHDAVGCGSQDLVCSVSSPCVEAGPQIFTRLRWHGLKRASGAASFPVGRTGGLSHDLLAPCRMPRRGATGSGLGGTGNSVQ